MTKDQALTVLRALPKLPADDCNNLGASETTVLQAWMHAKPASRVARAVDCLGGVNAAAFELAKDPGYWA